MEAEQVLLCEAIDVVLLDVRMPGKEDLILSRKLRVHSDTCIILIGARQDSVDLKKED